MKKNSMENINKSLKLNIDKYGNIFGSLTSNMEVEIFNPGEKIIFYNAPLEKLRFMIQRRAKILFVHEDGKQSIIHFVKKGEYSMKLILNITKSYIFYIISALGVSLGIVANIGVSSYNSMNLAVATMSDIKVGTITTFFNIIFLLIYMILTKFNEKYKYLVQGVSVFMFGSFINFFTYNIFSGLSSLGYIQRLLIFSGGTVISGLSIGIIIYYNIITFPLENVCIKISQMTKISFMKLRYLVDVFSLIISVGISMVGDLPIYVREGTIISMFLLSLSINLAKDYAEKNNGVKS